MTAKAPPLVSIRAVREAYGLSAQDLITRIGEQGVEVGNTSTIRNVELGHKRPSNRLLVAWAKALRLSPTDIVLLDPEPAEDDEAA
jgi:transcriptional regulator with XRE-family HTH domain